jgi:hypothetical protein
MMSTIAPARRVVRRNAMGVANAASNSGDIGGESSSRGPLARSVGRFPAS